jgi:phosphonate transport system substrate-binding protein
MGTLDPVYQDQDGDLLADPPDNPQLAISPAEITFSFVATGDSANRAEVWQPVLDALESRTGIPAKFVRIENAKDQLAALRNGALHVTAFSSGEVPTAVNSCGFTPFCTFGREDGSSGYYMQFIVRADSDVKDLADLRQRKIIFTRPRSNSGYKAALVLLMQEHAMLPERDYRWSFSYGHLESLQAVAAGEADAAPVASDVFDREVSKGELKAEDFRVIYESEKFPPVAFGCGYNLTSELREGIRAALLGLDWSGTPLEKEFGGDDSTKFVALTYKDDWANIRRVDEAAHAAKQELLGN